MSNVIELNIAEIDTVVGGAGAIQMATANQTATALAFPTATTAKPHSTLISNVDVNALLARYEVKR